MFEFDKRKTNYIKGIAVLLLLIHHLFYDDEILAKYTFINSKEAGFLLYISDMSKVCVSLFVFLSGYGLFKSYTKYAKEQQSFKDDIVFSFNHIKKLLIQYYIVVIPFMIYGILSAKRTLISAYGDHVLQKLVTDLLGVNYLLYGYYNLYNITCWYIGLALVLYLLYPLLHRILNKNVILFIGIVLSLGILPFLKSKLLLGYMTAFGLGIISSKYLLFERIINKVNLYSLIGSIILFVCVACLRNSLGILVDGFFSLTIVILAFTILCYFKNIEMPLAYLGKHSATIFMMHTFIYEYFFENYLFALKYPVLVLIALTIVCLVYSVLLEKIISLVKKQFNTKLFIKC